MQDTQRAVPIIDVTALYSGDSDAQQQLGEQFIEAYSTAGFSYITNHRIPQTLIDRVFAASAQFHALPTRQKKSVELNQLHRGFIPINTSTDVNSTLADVSHPNQSESFMVMREDGSESQAVRAGDYLAGPNQWPQLNGFREAVMTYNTAMTSLGQRLVRVIAQALNAERQLVPAFEVPTTWLRLLYYPAKNPGVDWETHGIFGSAPHTDFGCLTLLAQDDAGGLQVLDTAHEHGDSATWIDVPTIPGTFVVNAGDMLQRWSNGLLKSTPHRVINTSGKARYSCPFFFDPNVNTTVTPLASCINELHPKRFEPIRFGDFLRKELEAGYDHHKQSDHD